MGLLFIGVLAGILIGLGWFAPSQGYFLGCDAQLCFDRFAADRPAATRAAVPRPDPLIAKASPATTARSTNRSSEKRRASIDLAKAAPPATRIRVSPSNSAEEAPDPVLDKAKTSVAAKMEDPKSAEFGEMKRAIRKNTFGRPVDTICGRVKASSASGGETREMSFSIL